MAQIDLASRKFALRGDGVDLVLDPSPTGSSTVWAGEPAGGRSFSERRAAIRSCRVFPAPAVANGSVQRCGRADAVPRLDSFRCELAAMDGWRAEVALDRRADECADRICNVRPVGISARHSAGETFRARRQRHQSRHPQTHRDAAADRVQQWRSLRCDVSLARRPSGGGFAGGKFVREHHGADRHWNAQAAVVMPQVRRSV